MRVTASAQEVRGNLERIFARAVTERPQSGLTHASTKKQNGRPAGDTVSFGARQKMPFSVIYMLRSCTGFACHLSKFSVEAVLAAQPSHYL